MLNANSVLAVTSTLNMKTIVILHHRLQDVHGLGLTPNTAQRM